MNQWDLRTVARREGSDLMAELKSGKLARIGRGEVDVRVALYPELDPLQREDLAGMICRRVVELAV